MSTGGRIVLGLGVASSALLATWLLTGDRRVKTSAFVSKKAKGIKTVLKSEKLFVDDQMALYL